MPFLFTRRAGLAALLLAATATVPFHATAQGRPITIVVGSPAGGTTDTLARVIGRMMGDTLGQPVVVENRAGGNIAASFVAKAAWAFTAPCAGRPGSATVAACLACCSWPSPRQRYAT